MLKSGNSASEDVSLTIFVGDHAAQFVFNIDLGLFIVERQGIRRSFIFLIRSNLPHQFHFIARPLHLSLLYFYLRFGRIDRFIIRYSTR